MNKAEGLTDYDKKVGNRITTAIIIALLGSLYTLSSLLSPHQPTIEQITTRNNFLSGTATAVSYNALYDSPDILNTRGAINSLQIEVKSPEHDYIAQTKCNGVLLDVNREDVDNNPLTPKKTVTNELTATHCLKNATNNLIINWNGDRFEAEIIQQEILDSVFNPYGEYAVLLKLAVEDDRQLLAEPKGAIKLIDGNNINNTNLIVCGHNGAIAKGSYKYDRSSQYCSDSSIIHSSLGLIEISEILRTYGDCGEPAMVTNGNIMGVTVRVPIDPNDKRSYIAPLPPNAEEVRQGMLPNH